MLTAYSYRCDPMVPSFADDKPVIVFDGHCVFCSALARFVLQFDRHTTYWFLPAQSALGGALHVHYGLYSQNYETNITLSQSLPRFKSEAVTRAADGLGFPWSLVRLFRFLPPRSRAAVCDPIARNGFRIMRRRNVCYAPDPRYRDRFLG